MSGLSFLSKKSFHTTNVRNVEKVWLEEEKKLREEKKMLELRKQLEDERAREEMEELQESAGLVSRDSKVKEKLNWMYQGGAVGNTKEEENEDYLLGRKTRDVGKEEDKESKKLEDKSVPGSTWLQQTVSDPNERFRRMHEDPLLAIKRREAERIEALKRNPLQLQRARERAIAKLKEDTSGKHKKSKKSKKSKSKKEKKSKKKKKSSSSKKRKRRHSSDSSDSDSDSSSDDRKRRRRRGKHESESTTKEEKESMPPPAARSPSNKPPVPPPQAPKREGYGLILQKPNKLGPNRSNDDDSLGPSAEMFELRKGYIKEQQEKKRGRVYTTSSFEEKKHRPRSKEERDKALAEMERAGKSNEEEFRKREEKKLQLQSKEEEEYMKQQKRDRDNIEEPSFIRKQINNSSQSLEARINSKKFSRQRFDSE